MNGLQNKYVIVALAVVAAIVIGLQALATWNTTRKAATILDELRAYEGQVLEQEKTRSEVAALRIETELTSFYWHSLLTGLVPTATAFAALLGGWVGLRRFLDARASERAARETERLDRAANDLNNVLTALSNPDPRARIVGLVGLQHFFGPDKEPHHLRALSALAAAARLESDAEVLRALRICAEQAFVNVTPALLREVSWQAVHLAGLDVTGRDLARLDLRDADLEDARCAGADLSGALLTNGRLNGANLAGADLRGADLTYADFAGADLTGARLEGAVLTHTRVLRMDLEGADLRGAAFDPEAIPWDLVSNWRRARLDEAVYGGLIARYGPEASGLRVLMLMWEVPPLVAGGTWTACYHLVRNLRRKGADITVVVPWSEDAILPNPFGSEVTVVPMGIVPLREPLAPYGAGIYGSAAWSPYGSPYQGFGWSPYAAAGGTPWWSPYGTGYASRPPWQGGGSPAWSPYAWMAPPQAGGPAWASQDVRTHQALVYRGGAVLMRLTEQFARRLARWADRRSFDLIHAHDWVTFPAAQRLAGETGQRWVAHYHSLERDRREAWTDAVIEDIEAEAAREASCLVTPSRRTAERLAAHYGVAAERVTVVPNSLSPEEIPMADMGSFEARQVIFLGRLSPQKGPDLFEAVAEQVGRHRPGVSFLAYGEGEDSARLAGRGLVALRDKIEWGARGAAFRGASALLVTSRAEPFGMVILEGMQHRVPVLYPETAGAAEVLESGIRIDPADTGGVVSRLVGLLDSWPLWEHTVEAQTREIAAYPERDWEARLMRAWAEVAAARAKAPPP